jgi:hypothetical protein
MHSTETAVLRVLSDILAAVDKGDVAVLILLDLSAAFDTVDHDILLQRLHRTFGIDSAVLQWFRSYLSGRMQYIRRGLKRSDLYKLLCGVPQGSVLGPILFILYTADLVALIERFRLFPHLYADDTQVYGSCRPVDIDELMQRVSSCIDAVSSWMRTNRLQLNTNKTDVIWCATGRRLQQFHPPAVRIGTDFISPPASGCVRDLGIFIDADLSMAAHVSRTVSRCFSVLRQLRSVRRSLTTSAFQTLMTSLVATRLDYGNAVLYGIAGNQLRRLQAVLNAGARLIFGLRRSDHVSDALMSLHWLRVPERIIYKTAVLTYRALHGSAPRYLSDALLPVAEMPNRRRLRSSTFKPAFSSAAPPRCRCPIISCRRSSGMEQSTRPSDVC